MRAPRRAIRRSARPTTSRREMHRLRGEYDEADAAYRAASRVRSRSAARARAPPPRAGRCRPRRRASIRRVDAEAADTRRSVPDPGRGRRGRARRATTSTPPVPLPTSSTHDRRAARRAVARRRRPPGPRRGAARRRRRLGALDACSGARVLDLARRSARPTRPHGYGCSSRRVPAPGRRRAARHGARRGASGVRVVGRGARSRRASTPAPRIAVGCNRRRPHRPRGRGAGARRRRPPNHEIADALVHQRPHRAPAPAEHLRQDRRHVPRGRDRLRVRPTASSDSPLRRVVRTDHAPRPPLVRGAMRQAPCPYRRLQVDARRRSRPSGGTADDDHAEAATAIADVVGRVRGHRARHPAARSAEIEAAAPGAARPARAPERGRLLRRLLLPESTAAWARRRRHDAGGRGAQPGRRLGGLDRPCIGGGSWVDLAGLPRATFDDALPGRRATVVAGVFNPTGGRVPVDGGYLVNGRWAFASGCEHADWIYGNCIDTSSGEPQLRIAVFEPSRGRHRGHLDRVGALWEREPPLLGPRRRRSRRAHGHAVLRPAVRRHADGPDTRPGLVRAHARQRAARHRPRRARRHRGARRRQGPAAVAGDRLAANPLFQHQLGDADVQLRAARSLLYAEADAAWATAVAGEEFTLAARARMRSAAVHARPPRQRSSRPPTAPAAGRPSTPRSPLQRRLRDVNAARRSTSCSSPTPSRPAARCSPVRSPSSPSSELLNF